MSLLALALAPALAAADACGNSDTGNDTRACIVRELTPSPTSSLVVDARDNGWIAVVGQSGDHFRVVAKISARARTRERAESLARAVKIETDSGRIAATGPAAANDESWSVSYDVSVPHGTDLDLKSHNGGLSVTDVNATVTLSTTNGGIALVDVNGLVRGTTTNGGVSVVLSDQGWQGKGLDVQTTNGGIDVSLPRSYSATLDVGTTHGGVDIDVPGARMSDRTHATLGSGGAPIRLATTNGGVSVRAER